MSRFRTTFAIPGSPVKISYQSPVLLAGSCFTENIGKRLSAYRFPTLLNPGGIIFNPVSLAGILKRVIEKRLMHDDELLYENGRWLSLEHHGSFSNSDKNICLQGINAAIEEAHRFIQEANVIIITLGSAWVYEYRENGQIVANCHKIPQTAFHKRILVTGEIIDPFRALLQLMKSKGIKAHLCFTLSPVRHWRDGAVENQWSKSLLHAAIQQLVNENAGCSYFPAYELMMDDLRDYRFYEADMIHPNAQAVDYIWEKFGQAWISTESRALMQKIEKINQAFHHRPLQPDSIQYRHFAKKQVELIEDIRKANATLDFREELAYFGRFC